MHVKVVKVVRLKVYQNICSDGVALRHISYIDNKKTGSKTHCFKWFQLPSLFVIVIVLSQFVLLLLDAVLNFEFQQIADTSCGFASILHDVLCLSLRHGLRK